MNIGSGRLGLRSAMRDFPALVDDSGGSRETLLDLQPGVVVSGWSLHSGAAWLAGLTKTHDGVALDVAAVRSSVGAALLVRVETIALCVSTAGSYYYDPTETTVDIAWDDAKPVWDDGILLWDQFPKLYVHLSDGSSPADASIAAHFAFHFAERSCIHPELGPEKLSDPGIEAWTSATVPTTWAAVTGAGATVNRDSSARRGRRSLYAARMDWAASSAEAGVQLTAEAVVSGFTYRLAGSYRTSIDNPAGLVANVRAGAGGNYVVSDGRSFTSGTGGLDLSPTYGEWRRFALDFRSWLDSSAFAILLRGVPSGSVTGSVWFDNVTFRRVVRYAFWEPRLASDAAPAVETGEQDLFFGQPLIGSGNVSVINEDGLLDESLGDLNWTGQRASVFVGGRFMDGEALTLDAADEALHALTLEHDGDDGTLSVGLEDARESVHVTLPSRSWSSFGLPLLDSQSENQGRALLFGTKANIRPIRFDMADEFGVYEVADCQLAPNGIKAIDAVYAYLDQDSADKKLATGRVLLEEGADYSADLTTAQITLLRDVGPYPIEKHVNDYVDISFDSVSVLFSLLYEDTAYFLTPAPSSSISGTVGFTWTAPAGATKYWLSIGSTEVAATLGPPDVNNLYWSEIVPASASVPGLPGTPLYAALWTYYPDHGWITAPLIVGYNGAVPAATPWVPIKVTRKLFTAAGLCSALQDGINQILALYGGVGTVTVTLDEATHKVTVTKSSGTFGINIVTTGGDARASLQVWPVLGFTGDVDLSGALTYTGADKMFDLTDDSFKSGVTTEETVITEVVNDRYILRVDARGYKDDASGTYTGSANALISTAPAIVKLLWVRFMKQSASMVSVASFATAAAGFATAALGLYVQAAMSTGDLFVMLERSVLGRLTIDGDGILYFDAYPPAADADAPVLADRDFVAISASQSRADVYAAVSLLYDRDPATGAPRTHMRSNTDVPMKYGTNATVEFECALTGQDAAAMLAGRLAALAALGPRMVNVTCGTKLFERRAGQVVYLQRDRAPLGMSGFDGVTPFRINVLRRRHQEGLADAVLVAVQSV